MNAAATKAGAPVPLLVLAFACIYLIWGSTYLGIRFAIESMPPFFMVAARFLTAGALLYAWVAWRREATRPTLAEWGAAFLYGGCFFLVGNGGVSWAESRIPSGVAALLVAMVPLWMTVMEWFGRQRQRPTPLALAGLAIGFLGVAFLVGPGESLTKTALDPVSAAVMVVTTFGWAYGSLHAKNAPHPPSILQSVAMQMLAGGLLSGLAGALLGEWPAVDLSAVSIRSALAFAYLIVFGSIVAFTAYTWLLRVTRATRVGTYAFVNPIVAVFVGWSLGGEAVSTRTLVAGVVIVTGVVLILRARARGAEPAHAPAAAKEAA
jgi:drug/metabolite transporter (DMT)-like permease